MSILSEFKQFHEQIRNPAGFYKTCIRYSPIFYTLHCYLNSIMDNQRKSASALDSEFDYRPSADKRKQCSSNVCFLTTRTEALSKAKSELKELSTLKTIKIDGSIRCMITDS